MPEDYRQIAKRRHDECSAISAGLAVRYRTLHEIEKSDGDSDFLELEEALASLRECERITDLQPDNARKPGA